LNFSQLTKSVWRTQSSLAGGGSLAAGVMRRQPEQPASHTRGIGRCVVSTGSRATPTYLANPTFKTFTFLGKYQLSL